MSSNEEKIRIKENHLKKLMVQYEALYKQKSQLSNAADKEAIQLNIDSLGQEIEELEGEIERLKSLDSGTSQIFRDHSLKWEERLPEINFSKSKRIIRSVFDRFDDHQDEEAVFLLQRSRSMGGDLCIKHIKSLLQSMGGWYPPCEYGFPPYQQTNPIDFLNALALQFDADPVRSTTQQDIAAIARKICDPLRGGNVLLIHIDVYSISEQDSFLAWFINDFWRALIHQISIRRQSYPLIKLVSIIAVRGIVPKSCLQSALCCDRRRFDSRKILDLPLQAWTEKEICNWLWKFSGLDAPPIGLTRSNIECMAKTIHEVSQGKPSDVCDELMEALKREMTGNAG